MGLIDQGQVLNVKCCIISALHLYEVWYYASNDRNIHPQYRGILPLRSLGIPLPNLISLASQR